MISLARMRAILLALMILILNAHSASSDNSRWSAELTEGRKYLDGGNLWAAEQHAKASVLEARRFGMADYRLGRALDLLSNIYYLESNSQEAKQSAQEALVILKNTFGAASGELIGPLQTLANASCDEGNFDASLRLSGNSIAIAEKSRPAALPKVLTTYKNILTKMGKFEEAEAVKRRLSSLTGVHQNNWGELMTEATSECSLSAWPMAEKTVKSAIDLAQKERTAGSDMRLAQSLALLSKLYYDEGKYRQAAATARGGMPLFEKATVPQKCELLSILAFLGKASARTGDVNTAIKSFGRLYNLAAACKDKGAAAIAITLDDYRELLLRLGRKDEYLKVTKGISIEAIKELSTAKSNCPQHTLNFPDNYRMGDIYVISNADERLLGIATGRVHVDAGTPLELHVINTDLTANTKSLSPVASNEFWSLSFARSNISDNGMPCFSKLSDLHEIDLHSTSVTDVGMAFLSGLKSLYAINLGRTQITTVTLSRLSDNLEPTSQLDLSNTNIDEKAGTDLTQLSLLMGLSLAGTKISDATVQQLVALKHLESLNLSRTPITDKSGQYIAQMANLKKLSLTDTKISDASLKLFTALRQLENLNLSRTRLTDEGLKYLTQLPSLKTLSLDGTKITMGCIPQLKRMSNLKELSLFATQPGLPGRIHVLVPGCQVHGH